MAGECHDADPEEDPFDESSHPVRPERKDRLLPGVWGHPHPGILGESAGVVGAVAQDVSLCNPLALTDLRGVYASAAVRALHDQPVVSV